MADEFEYLDAFNLLGKMPANFYEESGTSSKKWQERKEALEALLKLIADNPKLESKGSYGELIETLTKLAGKDANIHVNVVAVKCLAGVAYGLRASFGSHAANTFPTLIEKLKEKKPLLREPVVDCMDKIAATTTLDSLQDAVVSGLENKNPQIKAQTAAFLYRVFKRYNDKTGKAALKAAAPLLVKNTADADGEVRTLSMEALGSMLRATGPGGNALVKEIVDDKARMEKITAAKEQAAQECAQDQASVSSGTTEPARGSGADTNRSGVSGEAEAAVPSASEKAAEADPFDFLDPVDILSKLPNSFYEEEGGVHSKKWQERKDSLDTLLKLLTDYPKLEPKTNYGELVGTLNKILAKDANINVAAVAAKCLGAIANGLRGKFSAFATSVVPTIIEKFKEKKPLLREPLVECVDYVLASTEFDCIEEVLNVGLENKNPQIKAQTDLIVERYLRKCNPTTMSKKVKNLCVFFVKHTGDPDAEVREAAYNTLGAIQRIVGEKVVINWCSDIAADKMKMTKIQEACQKLVGSIGECSTAKPAAPPAAAKKAEVKAPAATVAKEKTQVKKASASSSRAPSPEAPQEETKASSTAHRSAPEAEVKKVETLKVSSEKPQRIKDEAALKILKWNFNAPTEEHVIQLNTLLSSNAKASLISLLFSKDFKMHIKACEELMLVADSSPEAIVSNSDLLLKWCTLRFFETNPSALIKVLDLALRVVRECLAAQEPMVTAEVNAFVPYLLTKLGDPKDHIRNVAKEIVDTLTEICGPAKLAQPLTDGLKIKNVRQRAEILRILTEYIDGGAFAQLKPLGIMKTLAPFVADADKNVREAALMSMAAAYRCDGDAVFKAAGRIADKEMAMIQERIKRLKIVPGSGPIGRLGGAGTSSSGARVVKPDPVVRPGQVDGFDSPPRSNMEPPQISNRTVTRGKAHSQDNESRRFNLDETMFADAYNEMRVARMNRMQEIMNDVAELEKAIVEPNDFSYSNRNSHMHRTPSQSSIASSVETLEQLDRAIADVGSTTLSVAREALAQLMCVAQSPEQLPLLHERVDSVLQMCTLQLESQLATARFSSVEKALEFIRNIFNFIQIAFIRDDCNVITHLTAPVCEAMIKQLIFTVSSQTLAESSDAFSAIGRTANIIVIRLCKLCKPAVLFEAVVHNMIISGPSSDEYPILLRILHRFVSSCSDINYVSRVDLRQFFIALSEFFGHLEKQSGGPNANLVAETMDFLQATIERVTDVFRDQASDTLRRIPRPNVKIVDKINALLSNLKDKAPPELPVHLPGQVEAAAEEFSFERFWVLVHAVSADFTKMPRTIPSLANMWRDYPARIPTMEQKLENYMHGSLISSQVKEFLEKGENMIWPSEDILAMMCASRDVSLKIMGDETWGERKNPLCRAVTDASPIMTNSLTSALPNVVTSNEKAALTNSSATVAIRKKVRRSGLTREERDDVRSRLNALVGERD